MKCKKKRTIFDLFEIYKCENCEAFKNDEEFYLGRIKITIIYAENYCYYNKNGIIEKDELIEQSQKVRLFLKDAIISQVLNKEVLLLWIEEFSLEKYDEIIDALTGFELDIFMLTNF